MERLHLKPKCSDLPAEGFGSDFLRLAGDFCPNGLDHGLVLS